MRNVLIDAGPLIALFATDDKHHIHYDSFVKARSESGLRLLTTWPCLVEASYILDAAHRFELLRWVELGGVVVYPFEPHHLGEMLIWMQRYTENGKREMDLADATLYWLAVETGVTAIMTVDTADFCRYRLPNGQSFTII